MSRPPEGATARPAPAGVGDEGGWKSSRTDIIVPEERQRECRSRGVRRLLYCNDLQRAEARELGMMLPVGPA